MTSFWLHGDHVIYPGQPGVLAQYIPDLKPVNGSYFAVPNTLPNLQVMRWYQYSVPEVINDKTYDFPIAPPFKPLPHQRVMANFSVLHRRMFNLSDMGTMKTISTLWAADFLMQQHPKGEFRAVIVAPLSTLDRVWASAIFKNFLGRRTFEILHGTPAQRSAALERDADFYIINFDGVATGAHTRRRFEIDGFSKTLMERSDIQLCVIDEASAYKDPLTLRHRIARDVLGRRSYLWLLTGTPTPNAPTDAYGLAKLVNNAWGKSKTGFKMETMYQPFPNSFKWLPKKDGYEKARQLLSPSIRYDLKDIWNGPECVTQQRSVELTGDQKKQMAELKKTLQVTMKSGAAIGAINEAAARQKFIQVSLGAVYDSDHKVHLADARPRISALHEILDEAPGKTLIFAPLTSVVEMLARELKGTRKVAIVNGNVSQKDRTKVFADFQEGDLEDIIADPGTMAHGLDLWMARTVIWYGTTDKAELYAQANRRAHRPGQKYPVNVVQLVSNPLEIEIFRRLENNLSLQGSLLTMIK
jgi:Helicase conserved C-terminal domain/SNF2-related domain